MPEFPYPKVNEITRVRSHWNRVLMMSLCCCHIGYVSWSSAPTSVTPPCDEPPENLPGLGWNGPPGNEGGVHAGPVLEAARFASSWRMASKCACTLGN